MNKNVLSEVFEEYTRFLFVVQSELDLVEKDISESNTLHIINDYKGSFRNSSINKIKSSYGTRFVYKLVIV